MSTYIDSLLRRLDRPHGDEEKLEEISKCSLGIRIGTLIALKPLEVVYYTSGSG